MRRMRVRALAVAVVVLLALGYLVLLGFDSSLLDFSVMYNRRETNFVSMNALRADSTPTASSAERASSHDVRSMQRSNSGTVESGANPSNATDELTRADSAGVDTEDGEEWLATADVEVHEPAATLDSAGAAQAQGNSAAGLWLDEILTPELVKQIESREPRNGSDNAERDTDPLVPVQVHMVWIGNISKAPNEHTRYRDRGYNFTVHSDPEEILDGFLPFVLKAYRLALPSVVGYDFLKFALLYKYGGLSVDADTYPAVDASEVQREFPRDGCDLVFGKEATAEGWEKPVFRKTGSPTYGLARPFQILNWAMAAAKPRNRHVKWLMETAMMHFFGLRDMELSIVQDISGSGLMTDYVALLYEKHGRSYREVYEDNSRVIPVEGLCLTDDHFHGTWIRHLYTNSWRQPGAS